jgi:hypothetical protein
MALNADDFKPYSAAELEKGFSWDGRHDDVPVLFHHIGRLMATIKRADELGMEAIRQRDEAREVALVCAQLALSDDPLDERESRFIRTALAYPEVKL